MSDFPLTPDNKPNQGPNKPLVGGAVALLLILSAILLKNIGNDINPHSIPNYYTNDGSDGLGNDLPLAGATAEPLIDLDYNAIYSSLSQMTGVSDITMRRIEVGGLKDQIEFVFPVDMIDLPHLAQALQWGDPMVGSSGNPLLDRLVRQGNIVLSRDSLKYGVDYETAFNAAAANPEGYIETTTKSGTPISVTVQEGHIKIQTREGQLVHLQSDVDPVTGLLSVILYTRGSDGNIIDLNFNAGEYYDAMMKWYADNGIEISGIKESWNAYSVNTQVVNQLTQQGYSPEAAIDETATRKFAAKHGFTRTEHLAEPVKDPFGNYTNIEVLFLPPLP